MDNSMRNAEALNKRLDEICDKVMDSHAKTIAKAEIDEQTQTDYASTAQNEMAIAEEANALIKNAQDLSTMIRELQELWLFGSLDTLTDPADSAKDKEKALQISQLIETLAKKSLEIHAGEKE